MHGKIEAFEHELIYKSAQYIDQTSITSIGVEKAADLLIKAGANLNNADESGWTATMWAALQGFY